MKRARENENEIMFDYGFVKYFITTFFLTNPDFKQRYSEHICGMIKLQTKTCDSCRCLVQSTCRCYLCSYNDGRDVALYCRRCVKFCKTCRFHVCNKHYTSLHKTCPGNEKDERAKIDKQLRQKQNFVRTLVSFIIVRKSILDERDEELKKTRDCEKCKLLKIRPT